MSDHIDVVKRAIEFKKPDYLPMEIIDVPGIYNAYHTLDPATVELIPGTENFDALWPCCYTWSHQPIGKTPEGEILKQDQFGVRLKTPLDMNSTYALMSHPLAGKSSLDDYEFPDPEDANDRMDALGNTLRARYADRFVDAHVDAGIFLTTQCLFGIQEFFMTFAETPLFVTEVYERVMEYYRALLPKLKRAGAHMVTVIEDLGSREGLLIQPDLWRQYIKPITKRFIQHVHDQDMYAGLFIDGSSRQIMDDLLDMGIDCFTTVDIQSTGVDVIRDHLKGKICLRAAVDMQTTLPMGTPQDVANDARELVSSLNSPEGGLICQVVRWHRPKFPPDNVRASVDAFNTYRPK